MTDRKHPSATFWITVALVALLVAYPLSFGPACWLTSRIDYGRAWITTVYFAIIWTWDLLPYPIQTAIERYTEAGAADHWGWCTTNYHRPTHPRLADWWGRHRVYREPE
jgi:hypothetical protein